MSGLKESSLSSAQTISHDFELDAYETTNQAFAEFVKATSYVTDSERYGWSFVFELEMDDEAKAKVENVVRDVEWWMQVNGSYWREPQGPGTDVFDAGKARYPVVQVILSGA